MSEFQIKKKSEYNAEDLAGYLTTQVIWDSNERDSITGRELTKRIKGYHAVDCPANVVWALSCLRLCDVYIYKKKDGEKYVTSVFEANGKEIVCAFSTPKHLQRERFEGFTVSKVPFTEFFHGFKDGIDMVAINPFTDAFIFQTKVIDEIFSLMDSIEEKIDADMVKGVSKEDLHDFVFWRFWGRNIYCKLCNGTEVVGKADNKLFEKEFCLEVTTEGGEVVTIYKSDVEFIQDLGFRD